jgi:predicted ferric reductase
MSIKQKETQEYPDSILSVESFFVIILALGVGMLVGVMVLPTWLPHLAASLLGPNPKAFWYLSRGSAFVALSLLWLSMALGLLITNKISHIWPGAPTAFAIHEYVSLLGLAFAMFHAIVLAGDRYINYNLAQIFIPFASSYQPLWVGLGQIGFYAMLIVTLSFYVRQNLGHATWRLIHYASFLTYLIALFHGLTAGTDTTLPWAQGYYWISAGSLLFLTTFRIVSYLGKVTHERTSALQVRRHQSGT